jgi:hypothetical protein
MLQGHHGGRQVGWIGLTLAAALAALATLDADQAAPDRTALCATVDRPAAEAARTLEPLGEPARAALATLAASAEVADAACGVAGLAALRDRRVVPPVMAALKNPAFRDDAYRFARWAAYVAGGPDGDLGAAFAPVVGLLADAALWTAAGDDAIRLLGEIDQPAARDRLVAELERPQKDTTLDAIINALARQGEPRPRARVVALGQEAVAARSGNLTYEQASRIGAVAFYLLALDSGSRAEGLQMLRHMVPDSQADAGAWAAQTWCERAVRRPADRATADQARAALVAELDGMNVGWRTLVRGSFACEAAKPGV